MERDKLRPIPKVDEIVRLVKTLFCGDETSRKYGGAVHP